MSRALRLVPLAVALVVVAWWLFSGARPQQTRPVDAAAKREAGEPQVAAPTPPVEEPQAAAPAPPPGDPEGEAAAPVPEDEAGPDEIALAWSKVNLDQVRAALPDNLYWQNQAPTTDEAILEQREQEKARLNDEYGKILSGNASEEEIRQYYDYKAKVSGDAMEFSTYLLDHYGGDLPERDVGLLELARKLHAARLEEIPRKLEEALDRKHEQDAARAAWQADEREFGDDHED